MDTSDNAGIPDALRQCLRDTHVQRFEFAAACRRWPTHTSTEALTKFFEALKERDPTRADTILRSWGIRR